MRGIIYTAVLILVCINSFAQIDNLVEKFNLPTTLNESSGLIFFNNKLISHNDSGNNPNLYELDTITGAIDRTILISNVTNVDWEDIAHDESYIYIADFGNNNGNRTDLKVYRIEKSSYQSSTTVTADVINFSYEDQTDFTTNDQTNFNAEAMVIYNDNILVFTKNSGDLKTNAYIFPKTIGTHTATKIGTYNVQGLVTGATYNTADNSFFLTGYSTSLQPFLVYINNFTGNSVFGGTIVKTDITPLIGQGSQLEGITDLGNDRYFLSREKIQSFVAKVYAFSSLYVLDVDSFLLSELVIYPNPFVKYLQIKSNKAIKEIEVFDFDGKKILVKISADYYVDLSSVSIGTYFVIVHLENGSFIKKKFIKK